jgi:lysyl endopeptidase
MKKLLLSLFAIISLFLSSTAQLVSMGLPVSLSKNVSPASSLQYHEMPGFDLALMQREDSLNDYHKIGPWRFGKNFDVDFSTENSGQWTELPGGDRIWRIRLYSEGALTMNVIFSKYYIPEGAHMFMYTTDLTHFVGAYTSLINNPDSIIGSEIVNGNDIIIEYYEPQSVRGRGELNIGTVTHGYRSLHLRAESLLKSLNSSGSCNIDVLCPLGVGWEQQIQSVAMIVVNGNGSCTGALINNTSNDGKPYFLTANHCLGNPASWVFRFNWHSPDPSCATTTPSTNGTFNQTTFNSILRANRADSDFALVELNNNIPDSWNPYYAGWDRTGTTPNFTVGIHHPRGDIKKICKDNDPPNPLNTNNQPVWRVVRWDAGVTEPGSSGSPLFNENKKIVGQLWRGTAACSGTSDNGGYDEYGRFDASWDGAAASSRLRDWLDPGNTGITILDGYDPNAVLTQNDAGIINITNPNGDFCGATIAPVVELRNFGSNSLTSVTIQYSVNGGSNQNFNWTGNLASNQITTVTLPTINLNTGNNTLAVSTSNPNSQIDENPANDSRNTSFNVSMLPSPGVTNPGTICAGENTTISASPSSGGNLNWYNSPSGNNPIQQGNNLSVNLPGGSYSYYVQEFSDTSRTNVGPVNFMNGGFFSSTARFLIFDVQEELILHSVKVNAQSAGNRTIQLRNSSGQVLQQIVVNIPSGISRVNLNFRIAPGTNYQLGLGGSTNGLWRSDDATNVQFPYSIPGLISITESDAGVLLSPPNPNRYYYSFYEWEVSRVSCSSPRVMVGLTVNDCSTPTYTADFSASSTEICAGSTINFNDLSSENPTSWNWQFPGGTPSSSGQQNPSITYNSPGVYSVTLTVSGSLGSDIETRNAYITVYENPSATVIATENAACPGAENGSISVNISGGSAPYSFEWSNGANTQNLSDVTSGNYTLTVTDNNLCSTELSASIGNDTGLSAELTVANLSNSFSISVEVTGGTAPFTYSWNHTTLNTSFVDELSYGTYTVTVSDANDCFVTETVVIEQSLSVTDWANTVQINAYPNPVSSEINVDFKLHQSERIFMSVFNATGQLIYQSQALQIKEGTEKIPVGSLATGVYFIRVQSENGVKVIPFNKQ